jgi:magnesium transporter
MATELRETNAALLEARQNEIMKTLTVANFIFLPLELIAFVFGMHALGTPLESNPNAFWIIMAFMLGIIGVMTIYFARKRWIF